MPKNEEREIKLQMPKGENFLRLQNFLAGLYCPGPVRQYHMSAVYYDTADNFLRKHQLVYRVRRENNNCVATVKGKNIADGILGRRMEINKNVGTIHPDLRVFMDVKKIVNTINKIYDMPLIPLVKNVFLRKQSLVFYKTAKIELVIDQGIIYGRFHRSPIWELELELKRGDSADILHLAKILSTEFALQPSYESKFSRGLK